MLRFLNTLFILGSFGVFVAGFFLDDTSMMGGSVLALISGELLVFEIKARRGWWAFLGDSIDDSK